VAHVSSFDVRPVKTQVEAPVYCNIFVICAPDVTFG